MKIKRLTKRAITPMTTANLVEIFCILDDFCKIIEPEIKNTHSFGRQTAPQPLVSDVRQ